MLLGQAMSANISKKIRRRAYSYAEVCRHAGGYTVGQGTLFRKRLILQGWLDMNTTGLVGQKFVVGWR